MRKWAKTMATLADSLPVKAVPSVCCFRDMKQNLTLAESRNRD